MDWHWRRIPFTRSFVAFAAEEPVKHFLRNRSVLTLLAVAGLMLSVAALFVVIGIAETQIVSAEEAGHHQANLFANGWFDVGLGLAAVGILIGTVAVSAISSQGAALREFPNLVIRVLLRADYGEVREPGPPDGRGETVRLAHVRLLVKNEERNRDVTLPVSLVLDTHPAVVPVPPGSPPASAEITPLGFPPATWTPAAHEVQGVPDIQPMGVPIRVGAGGQEEGDIFFVIPQRWVPGLVGGQRGRVVVMDRKTDKAIEFEYGYPDDQPLQ